MKNKKKMIVIISSIIVITFVTVILILINTKSSKKININNKEENKKCIPFTGGSYNLIFETNSNDKIDLINVCIACSPDSYPELPIPKNEGYEFDGWYYDKDLKNKVNAHKTNEITTITKKDKNNCMTGYKDIKLYAKWKKIENIETDNNTENKTIDNITQNKTENNDNSITYNEIVHTNTDIIVENNVTNENEVPTPSSTKLKRPTKYGYISRVPNDTTRNGYNKNAYESFIQGKCDDNVYALGNGKVLKIYNPGIIVISQSYNEKKYLVAYMDLSIIYLSQGQSINSDTVIGKGMTGNNCGLFSLLVFPYEQNNLSDEYLNNFGGYFSLFKSGYMVNPIELFDIPSDNKWNTR